MNTRDLLKNPIWRGEELGCAIPPSPHAVSVALPRWQDVVGYEEKAPEVVSKLQGGYPRFVIHPLVHQVAQQLGKGHPCLPFPSILSAERCVDFVSKTSHASAAIVSRSHVHGVVTDESGAAALKAFWQHTGAIVSSRQAEDFLNNKAALQESAGIRRALRTHLAGFYHCSESDVFLLPTGMAAHDAALRAVMTRTPGLATAQLGFPYVDTLKLQQKLGKTGHLLHDLDNIDRDLSQLLKQESLAACFCEIPGNPLLGSVDVRTVSPILREKKVPLVVDDVVATPVNIDLSHHADLISTSLTKFIAGTGEAMGGALICNPQSPLYSELIAIVRAQHEELLWGTDAQHLEIQARTFPERMIQHNRNGLFIAERLRAHPAVEHVWYPKWEFTGAYEAVRRPQGGWGALITFLPRNAETMAPKIFDAMPICKGPSLGTIFSLACPFTLLAHYTELEWAESCGVSRNLIRISVGLEEPDELWQRLEPALSQRG